MYSICTSDGVGLNELFVPLFLSFSVNYKMYASAPTRYVLTSHIFISHRSNMPSTPSICFKIVTLYDVNLRPVYEGRFQSLGAPVFLYCANEYRISKSIPIVSYVHASKTPAEHVQNDTLKSHPVLHLRSYKATISPNDHTRTQKI